MPRFENKVYVMLESGEHFGHVDLAIEKDMYNLEIRLESRQLKRKNMVRRFTVQAIENCEMQVLRIDDLEKMKIEFPECFSDMFNGANDRLKKELILKVDVIRKCEQSMPGLDIHTRFASLLNYGLRPQSLLIGGRVVRDKPKQSRTYMKKKTTVSMQRLLTRGKTSSRKLHKTQREDTVTEEEDEDDDESLRKSRASRARGSDSENSDNLLTTEVSMRLLMRISRKVDKMDKKIGRMAAVSRSKHALTVGK